MREGLLYPFGCTNKSNGIKKKKKTLHFYLNRCFLHKCVVSDVIQKFHHIHDQDFKKLDLGQLDQVGLNGNLSSKPFKNVENPQFIV